MITLRNEKFEGYLSKYIWHNGIYNRDTFNNHTGRITSTRFYRGWHYKFDNGEAHELSQIFKKVSSDPANFKYIEKAYVRNPYKDDKKPVYFKTAHKAFLKRNAIRAIITSRRNVH